MIKRSLTAVLIFTLLNTTVASAHTVLISSNPKNGAVLKVLPTIFTLKFADPLLTFGNHSINKVSLTDPRRSTVALGKVLVRGALVEVQLSKPLHVIGKYRVSYRVSAQDGHIVTGSFSFTLKN